MSFTKYYIQCIFAFRPVIFLPFYIYKRFRLVLKLSRYNYVNKDIIFNIDFAQSLIRPPTSRVKEAKTKQISCFLITLNLILLKKQTQCFHHSSCWFPVQLYKLIFIYQYGKNVLHTHSASRARRKDKVKTRTTSWNLGGNSASAQSIAK